MNLALFDFDGTVTTHETMPAFMRRAVTPLRRALGVPLFAPMLALAHKRFYRGVEIA